MGSNSEYMRQWRNRNRERLNAEARKYYEKSQRKFQEYKLSLGGCVDCGYNEHPAALEFDHVRGDKLFNIGERKTMNWDKLMEEIDKCDLVCANCHRVRTAERGNWL